MSRGSTIPKSRAALFATYSFALQMIFFLLYVNTGHIPVWSLTLATSVFVLLLIAPLLLALFSVIAAVREKKRHAFLYTSAVLGLWLTVCIILPLLGMKYRS